MFEVVVFECLKHVIMITFWARLVLYEF